MTTDYYKILNAHRKSLNKNKSKYIAYPEVSATSFLIFTIVKLFSGEKSKTELIRQVCLIVQKKSVLTCSDACKVFFHLHDMHNFFLNFMKSRED